jgi:hypothetical protein
LKLGASLELGIWDLKFPRSGRPTIGTLESHNRSFSGFIGFWHAYPNSYATACYDFVWSGGTGIAIASTANKDFESN